MSIDVQDVLDVNLTLVGVELLNSPEGVGAFRQSVRSEITEVTTGIAIPVSAPAELPIQRQQFDLEKERISVAVYSERSAVSRAYPSQPDDLERLAEVASLAIDNTNVEGQELRAYGYNIDLVGQMTAGLTVNQLVATRVFGSDFHRKVGGEIVGGVVRATFEADGEIWNMRLEPRMNDDSGSKIFVSLNLHKQDAQIPVRASIVKSLRQVWEKVNEIVERLDG